MHFLVVLLVTAFLLVPSCLCILRRLCNVCLDYVTSLAVGLILIYVFLFFLIFMYFKYPANFNYFTYLTRHAFTYSRNLFVFLYVMFLVFMYLMCVAANASTPVTFASKLTFPVNVTFLTSL